MRLNENEAISPLMAQELRVAFDCYPMFYYELENGLIVSGDCNSFTLYLNREAIMSQVEMTASDMEATGGQKTLSAKEIKYATIETFGKDYHVIEIEAKRYSLIGE